MQPEPLSITLTRLGTHFTGEHVTVREIIASLPGRSAWLIMLLFTLPMAIPLPHPPGVSSIIALPMLLLMAQEMLNRHEIWLPARVLEKKIRRESFENALNALLPKIRKIEFFLRPRLHVLTHGASLNMIGFFGLVLSVVIMIPFPLTNTVPSMALSLMGIGIIMRDGICTLLGVALGIIWIYILIFLGVEGLQLLWSWLRAVL